ncbi:hypothetical protein RRG08_025416 [Elysia crispata]|uniref:Uncharacterized protein n=1 Tax=Elysia crispata TaxID=231223 RepID=A0AAE1DCG6_9GAST|nr:hypothetical protein RRG08_025416 [Elysia crispata]
MLLNRVKSSVSTVGYQDQGKSGCPAGVLYALVGWETVTFMIGSLIMLRNTEKRSICDRAIPLTLSLAYQSSCLYPEPERLYRSVDFVRSKTAVTA